MWTCSAHCIVHCIVYCIAHRIAHCIIHCIVHCIVHRIVHCIVHCMCWLLTCNYVHYVCWLLTRKGPPTREWWHHAAVDSTRLSPLCGPMVTTFLTLGLATWLTTIVKLSVEPMPNSRVSQRALSNTLSMCVHRNTTKGTNKSARYVCLVPRQGLRRFALQFTDLSICPSQLVSFSPFSAVASVFSPVASASSAAAFASSAAAFASLAAAFATSPAATSTSSTPTPADSAPSPGS